MAGFQSIVVTQKGQALLAKAQDGAPIVMTRWQIGTGALPVGTDLTAREALVSELMDLPISDVEISGRQATVKGQFINTGLSQFRWNELGLFAKSGSSEEILYAYSNSFGDGEDIEAGEVRVREFVFGATISMGTSATIDAQIDKGLIFVTKKELEAVAARDGYISGNDTATAVMGIPCAGGPLALDNIQGNTVLGGTPAYDAPVSMECVESPIHLHVAGKNLLCPTWDLEQQAQNDVSCTRDGNAFTLSGTNSGSNSVNFLVQRYDTPSAFSLPAGTYTISGMPHMESNNNFEIGLYHRLPQGTNEQLAYDAGVEGHVRRTFTLEEDTDNLFLAIRVGPGVNVDGVTITPQIEVGSQATEYEEPSNTIIEIPLLGTDGQGLEPLRMSYIGRYGDSNRVQVPDRIARRNGVWCVERNTAVADLTTATWGTSTNYLTPNLNGDLIRGRESHWVISTHFPPAGANPSTVWTAGIWMGVWMAINKASLPNGTATTPEEMTAWCAAQAEAGTPVLVCYARTEPVYEELHQDVQVLLNTQRVPGGTCSVWFEGDVLPSAADIGLPRGDYPCSDVEGAYRWLEELSNPLPPPTTADLYAWALTQQRGGVFATDGSTTTQNVPETGDLTGILSVTEQGSAVSMLVFGPTGKLYSAKRAAGVWRGWVQVYSDLTPPPLMGGAAASQAGTAGLVPAPAAGAQGKYLRGDGTWQTPYTHPSYAAKVSGLYKITVDKTGHVSGAETIHTGRAARFVIGTSTAGWTEADCDYLCDGTADEVEIKAAISALPSGGGEILLLDGTYNISSSIAISKANVVLRGSGPSTVLKRMFNSTSANGVIGCSAAHCRICSMDVDGNKTAYASDDNRAIYASQSASYIEIDHVTAKNSYNGISLSGMTGASILNCIVQTTSARGVYILGASGILMDGNLISGNGGTGIKVERTEDIRILNNAISSTVDYGIAIDAESKRGMISGNTCDQPQDNQSVMIHGSAFVVTGNVVGSISLGSGSKSNIVAHNILTSEDVSDTGTDNTVEGNKVVKEEATA